MCEQGERLLTNISHEPQANSRFEASEIATYDCESNNSPSSTSSSTNNSSSPPSSRVTLIESLRRQSSVFYFDCRSTLDTLTRDSLTFLLEHFTSRLESILVSLSHPIVSLLIITLLNCEPDKYSHLINFTQPFISTPVAVDVVVDVDVDIDSDALTSSPSPIVNSSRVDSANENVDRELLALNTYTPSSGSTSSLSVSSSSPSSSSQINNNECGLSIICH